MEGSRARLLLAGLNVIHASGLHRIAPPFMTGVGAILTFHHVRPARADRFQPNLNLEITPEFLDALIAKIKASPAQIVSLDEARRRIVEGDVRRRFVTLTFDDGYKDTRDFAYPILKRHGVPFSVFVPSSFADGKGDLWWVALERALAASDRVEATIGNRPFRLALRDHDARQRAFDTLYWALRALPDEGEMRSRIHAMADAAGIATDPICRELCLDWAGIAALARDPLVTIGAHTDTHIMLAKASEAQARADIERGVARTEEKLGFRPAHFCYPVGDPTSAGPRDFRIAAEMGFATALTTRRGTIYPEHRDHMMALPRISINGKYQKLRYAETLVSGVPTALANCLVRVDVA